MIVPPAPQTVAIRISKSNFVAGIQCLKRLYLQVHQPELGEAADAEFNQSGMFLRAQPQKRRDVALGKSRGGRGCPAEVTERVCCGMELDAKYVDVVVRRWEGLSGKSAVLEGDGRTFDEVSFARLGATASPSLGMES
jgi:hypothetical protein